MESRSFSVACMAKRKICKEASTAHCQCRPKNETSTKARVCQHVRSQQACYAVPSQALAKNRLWTVLPLAMYNIRFPCLMFGPGEESKKTD